MTFNLKYFLAALVFFLMEVFMAVYVRDTFIRPYGGDFLVVIFLYCLLKGFFRIPVKNAIFAVLIFAYLVETLQYFRFTELLKLQDNKIASVVLGSHFEWLDMLLYTLGGVAIYAAEKSRSSYFRSKAKTSA